jgi:hypothetical protein
MMSRPAGLILSAYLLVWVPVRFAAELLSTLPSLGMRGAIAIMELGAHAIVAMFSVAAAGRMFTSGSPGAFTAASTAVVAAGVVAIQSLFWTVLPRDVAPGTRLPLTAMTIAVTASLLIVIRRARRHGSA